MGGDFDRRSSVSVGYLELVAVASAVDRHGLPLVVRGGSALVRVCSVISADATDQG